MARTMPGPRIDPENRPFFDACAEGRLMLRRCTTCNEPHFYPRTHCPHCSGGITQWEAAAGTGTVYSFSIMRHPDIFVVAYVTLDEGVTMVTNIVDCDPAAVCIDMRVRVVFRPVEGGTLVPMFAPAH